MINTIIYFLITIIILVFVHELGHFLAAKFFKMRVDKFYLFFDFWNLRILKFVKGDTEYGIGVFPLGGYVKIAGMIDESMDKDFINNEPQPYEYRSKPVWQRMIVITAGVIMNLFLAFFLFYVISISKGETIVNTTTVGYVSENSVGKRAGFQPNDKIISINGVPVKHWEEIYTNIFIDGLGEDLNINVERNGSVQNVFIAKDDLKEISDRRLGIFPPDSPPKLLMVMDGRPAGKLGLQKEDLITYIDDKPIDHSQELIDKIRSNTGKEFKLTWQRNGTEMSGVIKPEEDSTIGIQVGAYTGPVLSVNYNALTAIPEAGRRLWYYGIELFVKSMYKIIKGDIAFEKAVGGPIKIAQIAGQSAESGIITFLGFMAMLSVTLAVINMLPFPALDGGHFVFLVYEAIFRKPVPHKVQIVVQNVGFLILMLFMVFVVYNDILHI